MWLWNPASVYVLKEHSQVPLSTVVCIFRDSDSVTSDQTSCGLPLRTVGFEMHWLMLV